MDKIGKTIKNAIREEEEKQLKARSDAKAKAERKANLNVALKKVGKKPRDDKISKKQRIAEEENEELEEVI